MSRILTHRILSSRLVLLALCAGSQPATAQIVNVQPLVVKAENAQGFAFAVDASVDYRAGNTKFLLLSAAIVSRYRSGPHLAFLSLKVEQGFQQDAVFLSRDFEHLRYRRSLLPWLDVEAFVQHDRDEFRRLALRALGGAGPRFVLSRAEPLTVAVGVAYMLEYELLRRGPEPDAGASVLAHRLSSYLALTTQLTAWAKAGLTTYAQPRLGRLSDFRALVEAEILVTIAGPLSVRGAATVAYDSEPPYGLEPLDVALKGAVHLEW